MCVWVNYNISLTWNKAIWGWFPLLTMIPVRSQWGRDQIYPDIYIYPYLRRPPGPPVVELFKNSHLRHQALQLDGWPRRNDRGDGNMTRIPWDGNKVITAVCVYIYIYNFVYMIIYIYMYIMYNFVYSYIYMYTVCMYIYIYIYLYTCVCFINSINGGSPQPWIFILKRSKTVSFWIICGHPD